jgi:hypothetical protein
LDVSAILSDEDVIEIYKRYLLDNNKRVDLEINSIKDVPKSIVDETHEVFKKAFLEKQDELLNRRGCTCFSEVNDNILLWSHYADGHRGICLEFDTSSLLFSKARKVYYSLDFPTIDPVKFLYGSHDEKVEEGIKPLFTKYENWSYEKEWRLFHVEPNKPYSYSVEALNSVYFGLSANYADIEIVCLILQGQSENIRFYKANKDKSKYSVFFEEFTYTPHIKIRR